MEIRKLGPQPVILGLWARSHHDPSQQESNSVASPTRLLLCVYQWAERYPLYACMYECTSEYSLLGGNLWPRTPGFPRSCQPGGRRPLKTPALNRRVRARVPSRAQLGSVDGGRGPQRRQRMSAGLFRAGLARRAGQDSRQEMDWRGLVLPRAKMKLLQHENGGAE